MNGDVDIHGYRKMLKDLEFIQNWICPNCQNENGEYNAYCEYCYSNSDDNANTKHYNPDKYYVREIRFRHLTESISRIRDEAMTPQEELFADFFNNYFNDTKVNALSDLELRAFREKMAKTALEAKAAVYASDKILESRKPKGPQGFQRSINTDDVSSDAINIVRERTAKLTKKEQVLAGLRKLYEKAGLSLDEKSATKLVEAGTILGRVKDKASQDILTGKLDKPKSEPRPNFNPFEKKS